MGTLKPSNRSFTYKNTVANLEESSYALQCSSFCKICCTFNSGSIGVVVSLFTKSFENHWQLQVCCSCPCEKVIEKMKQDMLNDGYISSETSAWKRTMKNCSSELIRIEICDVRARMDNITVSASELHTLVKRKDETYDNHVKRIKTESDDLSLSSVLVMGRRLRKERSSRLFGVSSFPDSDEKEEELESYEWIVRRPTQDDIDQSAKRQAIAAPRHKDNNPFVEPEIDAAVSCRFNRKPSTTELSKLSKELVCGQWTFVARTLGVDETLIQEISKNNPSKLRECIYQVLLKWKENDEDPTVSKLCLALIEEDMKETAAKVFEFDNKSVKQFLNGRK